MVKNFSFSEVQQSQIIVLHKEGHTERPIGERLGCSKTAVHQAIVKFKELGSLLMQNEVVVPVKQLPELIF